MLNKAIIHGKEHRREYRKAKACDRSCRNHGGCVRCEEGRQHFDRRRRAAADYDLNHYREENNGD